MFSNGGAYPAGPFPDLTTFHNTFGQLVYRPGCTWPTAEEPRKRLEEIAGFTDDVPVIFTHGDLDQSNILVSKEGAGPIRILALIDWYQSGWYPAHWEVLKAHMVASPEGDWGEYIPRVLKPATFEYYYAFEYVSMAPI